jgi:hypothetical protein
MCVFDSAIKLAVGKLAESSQMKSESGTAPRNSAPAGELPAGGEGLVCGQTAVPNSKPVTELTVFIFLPGCANNR